jgi:hypothetical protein
MTVKGLMEIDVKRLLNIEGCTVGAGQTGTWIMHRVRPGAAFDAVRLISYFALFY